MSASPSWDPATYAQFSDERSRPFADLIGRIGAQDPGLVVDLGCGNGPATLSLAALWPAARVVGVDSSEAMLETAQALDTAGRVEWVLSDLSDWDPASLGQRPDVIVTNSTLQWLPSHLALLPVWIEALADGGWFALQVPNNFDEPSHRLMREVAAQHSRAGELVAALDLPARWCARTAPRRPGGRRAPHLPHRPLPPRVRGGRVGDHVPAHPRCGRHRPQPCPVVDQWHRVAACARPARRRGIARSLRHPICRGTRRGLPADRGGRRFPIPPGVRRRPQDARRAKLTWIRGQARLAGGGTTRRTSPTNHTRTS